jgi:hypothetical protein
MCNNLWGIHIESAAILLSIWLHNLYFPPHSDLSFVLWAMFPHAFEHL